MLLSFLSNCLAFGLNFSFERIKIIKLENMNKIKDLIGCFTVNNLRNFNEARWLDGRHHHHFRHFVKAMKISVTVGYDFEGQMMLGGGKLGGKSVKVRFWLQSVYLADNTHDAAPTATMKSKTTKNIPVKLKNRQQNISIKCP